LPRFIELTIKVVSLGGWELKLRCASLLPLISNKVQNQRKRSKNKRRWEWEEKRKGYHKVFNLDLGARWMESDMQYLAAFNRLWPPTKSPVVNCYFIRIIIIINHRLIRTKGVSLGKYNKRCFFLIVFLFNLIF